MTGDEPMGAPSDYDRYVRAEWDLFVRNPSRADGSLQAVAGQSISRVLDIGCGAGQELLPFVAGSPVLGIGLDQSPEVGHAGRQLFANRRVAGRVAFVRGSAELLPMTSSAVDLVVCRLALPYTDNVRALAEMARVLRPGGVILLKFHHAWFYLNRFVHSLSSGNLRGCAYAVRVLLAGAIYHLTGRQPRNRFVGRETFQTFPLLRRELRRFRLVVQGESGGSTRRTPALIVVKER